VTAKRKPNFRDRYLSERDSFGPNFSIKDKIRSTSQVVEYLGKGGLRLRLLSISEPLKAVSQLALNRYWDVWLR